MVTPKCIALEDLANFCGLEYRVHQGKNTLIRVNMANVSQERDSMKMCIYVLCLLAACACMQAHAKLWQPPAGHTQIPIWPGAPRDSLPTPGPEYTLTGHKLIGGRPVTAAFNVSQPTMTVYAPSGKNTRVAVVVLPGGGFVGLARSRRHRRLQLADIHRGHLCAIEVPRSECPLRLALQMSPERP